MKPQKYLAGVASTLIAGVFLVGCLDEDRAPSCPEGQTCDSSTLAPGPYGVRADGTVDVTVEQAWPDRQAEPPALTADELANACSMLAACMPAEATDPDSERVERQSYVGFCLIPEISYFWEERAVPTSGKNERWTFEAREILASGGDCATINGIGTDRASEILCEEAGCWWTSPLLPVPQVSCQGSVATLTTAEGALVRDCARAHQLCDPSSATGCTDRQPVSCAAPAKDRCDGHVRLGCDGNNRVSFHDCSRVPGGTCAETADGVKCVYPDAGACTSGTTQCKGDSLSVCVLGEEKNVDCVALGLGPCRDGQCVAR